MASSNSGRLTGQTRKFPDNDTACSDQPPAQRRKLNNGQSQVPQQHYNGSNSNSNTNTNSNSNSNSTSNRSAGHNGQHTQPHPQATMMHNMESGLFRLMEFGAINDFERNVRDFVARQMQHPARNNIEIETKLGIFLKTNAIHSLSLENKSIWNIEEKERRTWRKYDEIGINSVSTIDTLKSPAHFHSQVPPTVFKHLNQVLNNWYVNAMSDPNMRRPELQNLTYPKISYGRVTEIDKLYENKVRVSLGILKPNVIKRCIKKDRVEDLNILFPRSGFDLRISSSLENKVPKPDPTVIDLKCVRTKDRISYKWDLFSIDISTIHSYNDDLTPQFVEKLRSIMCGNKTNKKSPSLGLPFDHGCEVSYEVELEIIDSKFLAQKADLCYDKSQNQNVTTHERAMRQKQFYDIVFAFMNHSLQLSELASQPKFIPKVCKLPERNKNATSK